jgi:hypothetical protein
MSFLVTKVAWVRVPSHSLFLFALSGGHQDYRTMCAGSLPTLPVLEHVELWLWWPWWLRYQIEASLLGRLQKRKRSLTLT